MKSCVLRFFYGEIIKCCVHDEKFVKPKQYVCFQLLFSVFQPRFRTLLRLAHSEMSGIKWRALNTETCMWCEISSGVWGHAPPGNF